MLMTGAVLALVTSAVGQAQSGTGFTFEDLSGPRLRIYAPSWVWQGVGVNVIVVIGNSEDAAKTFEVRLEPGKGAGSAFDMSKAELTKTVEVAAHSEERIVFTGFYAKHGGLLSHYAFQLSVDGRETGRTILIKTVRGTAFISEGWSLLALVALSGAWCAVVAVAMVKIAGRGTWRGVRAPLEVEQGPGWAREGKESR